MKMSKRDKRNKKCTIWGQKKNTRKFTVIAKSCVQRDKQFKERSDTKQNKGNDGIRARPHSTNPPNHKKEMPKESSGPMAKESLFNEEKHQQMKAYTNVI